MTDFMKDLEAEATEQLNEIRAYRTKGASKERAKVALGVIGNYVRFRATLANERTNDLVARRMELQQPVQSKQLTE